MRTHTPPVLILILLGVLAFGNSLWNGFVGDDHILIEYNTFYRSLDNIPRLFQQGYNFRFEESVFQNADDIGSGSVSYRPVDNLTYFIDYALWQLKPAGYHLTNLIIHVVNMVLVYLLFVCLGIRQGAALFGALLFGLHPIQSEAVCNIGYRADSLAAFFILSAFLFWIRFRGTCRKHWYVLSAGAFLLGVFSKESAVVFPLLVLLYDNYFKLRPRLAKPVMDRYHGGMFAVMAFHLYIYLYVFKNSAMPAAIVPADWHALAVHGQVVLTVLADYVRYFMMPWDIGLMPALYLPHGPPQLFVYCVPVLLVCVLAAAAYRNNRVMVFLVAWFLICFLPVSNIVAIPNPEAFRFMYLPSIGLLGALGIALTQVFYQLQEAAHIPRLRLILQCAAVGLCLILTILLNSLWKNDFIICSTWIKSHPDSWKAQLNMGLLYFNKGDYIKAEPYFMNSMKHGGLEQDMRLARYAGEIYLNMGQLDRAERFLNYAMMRAPEFGEVYYVLGKVHARRGAEEKALVLFDQALTRAPWETIFYTGPIRLLIRQGKEDMASGYLQRARAQLSAKDVRKLELFMDQQRRIPREAR